MRNGNFSERYFYLYVFHLTWKQSDLAFLLRLNDLSSNFYTQEITQRFDLHNIFGLFVSNQDRLQKPHSNYQRISDSIPELNQKITLQALFKLFIYIEKKIVKRCELIF